MSTAILLETEPSALLTETENVAPLSPITVAGVVKLGCVAPVIAAPPLLHWYENGAVPLAVTVNVAASPTDRNRSAGWVVIEGAAGTAGVELSVPPPPQSTSIAPASAMTTHQMLPDRIGFMTCIVECCTPGTVLSHNRD